MDRVWFDSMLSPPSRFKMKKILFAICLCLIGCASRQDPLLSKFYVSKPYSSVQEFWLIPYTSSTECEREQLAVLICGSRNFKNYEIKPYGEHSYTVTCSTY